MRDFHFIFTSTMFGSSGGDINCVSVIVYFCSVVNNSGLITMSTSSNGSFGRSGMG